MRASYNNYEKAAERCCEFLATYNEGSYRNAATEDGKNVSCMNCKHFENDKYCNLDIYDRIMKYNFLN